MFAVSPRPGPCAPARTAHLLLDASAARSRPGPEGRAGVRASALSPFAFSVWFHVALLAKGVWGTSWGSGREELIQKPPGDSEIKFSVHFVLPSTTSVIFGKLHNLKIASYPHFPSGSLSEKRKD